MQPVKEFKGAIIDDFGDVDKYYGVLLQGHYHCRSCFLSIFFCIKMFISIVLQMAHDTSNGAISSIKKQLKSYKPINIEVYKESADMAIGNCSGIM